MEASTKITKLCESWWERLSDSTKADQRACAEEFLALLGWSGLTCIEATMKDPPLSSAAFVIRGGGQSDVAAYFVLPGSLEPPSTLIERGLDFCDTTRLLVNGTRKLNIRYAFVTDLFRSYLYDAESDELLLHADSPEVFNREFVPTLSKAGIERGSLEELRRNPRSYVARQLREWCRHWSDAMRDHGADSDDTVDLVMDRLLVLRYLFDHDIMKRSDWRLSSRFAQIVQEAYGPDPSGIGKSLTTLFHDIWFDWKADLFQPDPRVDLVLENDEVAVPMLREFTLLSKTKFTIASILESFNYGEAAEKARVRLVPEPEEERDLYLAKQTLETVDRARVEVDVLEEGYRAIFFWFDKMVVLYERLGIQFDTETYNPAAVPGDLDLFTWSELDANRPSALSDKFQHVVESGLTVYYGSPRQRRTARLMLYLHLISAYDESKLRFSQFPSIETALVERPAQLDNEQPWFQKSASESGSGGQDAG